MSFAYKSIGSLDSVKAVNQKAKESIKDQVEMSQKMLCAMLTNQVPGNETNMSDVIQMAVATTNSANQIRGNELLEQNIRLNHAIFSTMMGSFEGNIVDHKGIFFEYQGKPQTIRYDYPNDAQEMKLHISDQRGHIVFTKTLSPDEQEWSWDGKNHNNEDVPFGLYQVTLEAIDRDDQPILDKTLFWLRNKVTEVVYDDDQIPVLMAGKLPIGDLKSYRRLSQEAFQYAAQPLVSSQFDLFG